MALLLVLLVAAQPILAQGPVQPQHSDPTWQASYWNNITLSGTPVLQRAEANLTYDWGTGAPVSGVNADYFSARWTRYIDVTPGKYRFTVNSDDGVRFWIDNVLLIDQWNEQAVRTFTVDQTLDSGHHLLKVEYFEKAGLATLKLNWQLLQDQAPPVGDWKAEYFNNITLGGTPVLVRNEAAINYNWGSNAPAAGVNADRFSVRWTRTLDMPAAMYTFMLTVDDGARMWVNGHLLVDAWVEQAATTYTNKFFLPGGSTTIEIQYYENAGDATARLTWTPEGGSPPPTGGTVIVDDVDTGFVKGGAPTSWRTQTEGYNGRLTWTYNNNTQVADYNWGRWYPSLQARRYEVFVYIPERFTTTGNARYWISHADGYTLKVVNQSTTGSQWVSLGTYRFQGNNNDYVSLSDVTYEAYRSRLIAFDAVKWEPR